MRGAFLYLLSVLVCCSLLGQTAPDIERGASPAVVRQLYGWPKGRSVGERREIWTYETFQVTFENGVVVNVAPKILEPQSRRTVAPRVNVPPAPTKAAAPKSTAPANNSKLAAPTPSKNKVSELRRNPAVAPQTRPHAKLANSSPTVLHGLKPLAWFAGFILTVIVVVALFRPSRRQRRGSDSVSMPAAEPMVEQRRTWQDEIAARLTKTNPIAAASAGAGREENGLSEAGAERTAAADSGIELSVSLLRRLEWKRFEQIVSLYYAETGIAAECTCSGPDGGIDVKLFGPGETAPFSVVQCKAWGAEKISLTTMREFRGAMADAGVDEGVFITTSDFWPDAREFAARNGIELVVAADFVEKFNQLPDSARGHILEKVTRGDYTTPSCPSCDRKMVWRASAGFWGCPRYPVCRSKPIYRRAE